jgi:hypothetical protein
MLMTKETNEKYGLVYKGSAILKTLVAFGLLLGSPCALGQDRAKADVADCGQQDSRSPINLTRT